MNIMNSRVAAVALGAAALISLSGVGGAVAAGLIGSADIADNSVRSRDVRDNTLQLRDISDKAEARLRGRDGAEGPAGPAGTPGGPAGADGTDGTDGKDGATGPAGADGKDGVMGSSVVAKTFGPTMVEFIGGRFADRATTLGSYSLPSAGTYVISTDGFFSSTAATSGLTRMQIAVRSSTGADLGTCFTGLISPLANRESTCNTTRTVTVDGPTDVVVKAFGYADDQGSADSGKVAALAPTSVVKIG